MTGIFNFHLLVFRKFFLWKKITHHYNIILTQLNQSNKSKTISRKLPTLVLPFFQGFSFDDVETKTYRSERETKQNKNHRARCRFYRFPIGAFSVCRLYIILIKTGKQQQ